MIQKANRIALLDEGAFQGWARSVNIVGPNMVATVSADTGLITYSGREVLTANRTYYVRTDGSDSNTGLVNNSGGAFATISKAFSVVGALDLSTFAVTIQLGNTGSYAGATSSANWIGGPGSSVTLIGDAGAASSYVITSTLTIQNLTRLSISGVDFTPSSGDGMVVSTGSSLRIGGACVFGAASGARQLLVQDPGSNVNFQAACTVDGSAANWILAVANSAVGSNGLAHAFSGTPAFSSATVQTQTGAVATIANASITGSATGQRYNASLNSVIFTNGGGANFFPGNVAGATATGGQYA